jgi:hypothetical protein
MSRKTDLAWAAGFFDGEEGNWKCTPDRTPLDEMYAQIRTLNKRGPQEEVLQ